MSVYERDDVLRTLRRNMYQLGPHMVGVFDGLVDSDGKRDPHYTHLAYAIDETVVFLGDATLHTRCISTPLEHAAPDIRDAGYRDVRTLLGAQTPRSERRRGLREFKDANPSPTSFTGISLYEGVSLTQGSRGPLSLQRVFIDKYPI